MKKRFAVGLMIFAGTLSAGAQGVIIPKAGDRVIGTSVSSSENVVLLLYQLSD